MNTMYLWDSKAGSFVGCSAITVSRAGLGMVWEKKSLLCQESSHIHSAHGQQFHKSIVANCGFMFLKNTEYGSISNDKNKILSEVGNSGCS
jgi:hypothetical protein